MPDYAAYRHDPASIPGIPAAAASPPAFVNVVGDGVALPRTWKASIAYQRRVTDWVTLTGSLLASATDRNYYYVDRLSRVLELVSIGEASQQSVVAEVAVRLPAGRSVWLAYTWNRSRDNSTYGCCLARTATTFTPSRLIRVICRNRGGRPTRTSATRR